MPLQSLVLEVPLHAISVFAYWGEWHMRPGAEVLGDSGFIVHRGCMATYDWYVAMLSFALHASSRGKI